MKLDDYAPIVGSQTVEELRLLAERLHDKSVIHVNSTAVGGGVAEILNRMVPMLSELGINTRWDVIKGGEAFYAVTKKFHNALHGTPENVTKHEFDLYIATVEENRKQMDLNADILFIHDPQPAPLIADRKPGQKWVWRCHVDVSSPHRLVWDFLRGYVEKYDACVFSASMFAQKLPIPQALIAPSIDPLSEKNRELTDDEVSKIMGRLQIPLDKPLITQVSRFDRLKDPIGVIDAFQMARRYIDARLLLVGGTADDDPEGAQVLTEVRTRAADDPDIVILPLPPTSNLEINAIQRASTIVMQKSLKEGFGLTVAEALWKGKPVIAGAVGGIPRQITHKYSGILVHSIDGAAYWMKQLISEPAYAKRLGQNGREHVRHNYLLTRHLKEYLLLFLSLFYPGKDLVEL